jgi:hypothetical protein
VTRSARLLAVTFIAFALGLGATPALAGGGPGPTDPFFALVEDTVPAGGTYQLVDVRCGTGGTSATLTMTGPFPSGDFVATGTVDLIAGTGELTIPPGTADGEYRLDMACNLGSGFAAAVFVGIPEPEPPAPEPEAPSAEAPAATIVGATPAFTG